jgi:hypothetical protein
MPYKDKDKEKQYQKEYREKNKEYFEEYRKIHKYKNNKSYQEYSENNKESSKKYYKTKDKIVLQKKEYYENNKEKLKQSQKEWRENNKDYTNKIARNKYKTDPLFKLKRSIRRIIAFSLKNKGLKKTSRAHLILGCSFNDFKTHIESKFEYWMTWDNYGLYNGTLNYGWDIDHIIPLATAINEDEVIRLNHYTNLRPLCSHINRVIKRNKIVY